MNEETINEESKPADWIYDLYGPNHLTNDMLDVIVDDDNLNIDWRYFLPYPEKSSLYREAAKLFDNVTGLWDEGLTIGTERFLMNLGAEDIIAAFDMRKEQREFWKSRHQSNKKVDV